MRLFIDAATFLFTGAPYSQWSDEAGMEYVSVFFAMTAFGLLAYFVLSVTGLGAN